MEKRQVAKQNKITWRKESRIEQERVVEGSPETECPECYQQHKVRGAG